jgi:hypothetical protein
LLVGVESYKGPVEFAWNSLGDDGAKKDAGFVGEVVVLNPLLFFGFEGDSKYDV